MWGAIAGVAAASLALALLHSSLEGGAGNSSKPEKPGALPEPGGDWKRAAGARPPPRPRGDVGGAGRGGGGCARTRETERNPTPPPPRTAADGKWKAPLWESVSAADALKQAKRVVKK